MNKGFAAAAPPSPTIEGDVSEVVHVDVLHLLTLGLILSHNFPHHLADQQHGVVIRSHVVVHLRRETARNSLVTVPQNGVFENLTSLVAFVVLVVLLPVVETNDEERECCLLFL